MEVHLFCHNEVGMVLMAVPFAAVAVSYAKHLICQAHAAASRVWASWRAA